LLQTADAAKAKGTTTQKYGATTKSQVCGDRLCSEIPAEERKTMAKSPAVISADIDSLFDRMDSIHKKHQSEMAQMWKSMTPQERSVMFQNMEQMIEQMESMSTSEHMQMMGEMIQDKSHMMHDGQMMMGNEPVYNEMLNPRQVDYPNVLGFNDLHIHAIRHLDVEKSHGTAEHLLQTIVHHHCKVYDDMTATCLLFPYGMTDQDKPYGVEYIITADQFRDLPEDEQSYWHYHKTEFPRAQATFPDLSGAELSELQPVLDETYGKVYYFWNYGDAYPMGEPYVLVVQDIPDQ
ncbi:MAG: DUF1264 domain-containing protein, partial [Nitrosopumilus sp.]|nr:DUF1264 domain-containing protein [Nitrosopumilus sp.]